MGLLRLRLLRRVCLRDRELRECFDVGELVIVAALLTFVVCRWKKFVSDLLV